MGRSSKGNILWQNLAFGQNLGIIFLEIQVLMEAFVKCLQEIVLIACALCSGKVLLERYFGDMITLLASDPMGHS